MPLHPNRERRRPKVTVLVDKINAMTPDQRDVFAKKCRTSTDNLRQIAYGWGGCSITLAKYIVKACDYDIELSDLIPELKELA